MPEGRRFRSPLPRSRELLSVSLDRLKVWATSHLALRRILARPPSPPRAVPSLHPLSVVRATDRVSSGHWPILPAKLRAAYPAGTQGCVGPWLRPPPEIDRLLPAHFANREPLPASMARPA